MVSLLFHEGFGILLCDCSAVFVVMGVGEIQYSAIAYLHCGAGCDHLETCRLFTLTHVLEAFLCAARVRRLAVWLFMAVDGMIHLDVMHV